MKEVLLYDVIYDWSAARLIQQFDENKSSDITLRIQSDGGSPEAAFGAIAKFSEHPKAKKVKVDGGAHSMSAFFLCYVDEVECLDVSEFMLHRAGYPNWYENNPDYMTAEKWAGLDRMNQHLRTAFEAKVDTAKFAAITGCTVDQLFSNEGRVEVTLNAQQAKEVGLVQKIVKITPQIRAEIQSTSLRIAAQRTGIKQPEATTQPDTNTNSNTMDIKTLADLKAQYPALVKEVQTEAVTAERDRVGAWMAFHDVDPEAVAKGIEEGTELGRKAMADLTRKGFSKEKLADIAADNPAAVVTASAEQAEKPAAAKKQEAFEDALDAELGIKKPAPAAAATK